MLSEQRLQTIEWKHCFVNQKARTIKGYVEQMGIQAIENQQKIQDLNMLLGTAGDV